MPLGPCLHLHPPSRPPPPPPPPPPLLLHTRSSLDRSFFRDPYNSIRGVQRYLQNCNFDVMREWKARRKERKANRHQLLPQSTPAGRAVALAQRMWNQRWWAPPGELTVTHDQGCAMPVALPKSDRLASRSLVATRFLLASTSLTTPVDM
jgi:hypothetical protein